MGWRQLGHGCGCGRKVVRMVRAGAGVQAGVGWYNAGRGAGVCGSNGGTTDKRGGMCRKRRKKAGYTITEILVA